MAIDPLPQQQLIDRVPQWWMDITPHDIFDVDVDVSSGPHDALQLDDQQRKDILEVADQDTHSLYDIVQLDAQKSQARYDVLETDDQEMHCPHDTLQLYDQEKLEYLTGKEDHDRAYEEKICDCGTCSTGTIMDPEQQSVKKTTMDPVQQSSTRAKNEQEQMSVVSVYMTDEEEVQEANPSPIEVLFERTRRRQILLQARRNALAQDAEEEDIQFRLLQRRRHPGLGLGRQQQYLKPHEEAQDHTNKEKIDYGGEQQSNVKDKSRQRQRSCRSSSMGMETQDQNESLHLYGNFERALIASLTSLILPIYKQQSIPSKEKAPQRQEEKEVNQETKMEETELLATADATATATSFSNHDSQVPIVLPSPTRQETAMVVSCRQDYHPLVRSTNSSDKQKSQQHQKEKKIPLFSLFCQCSVLDSTCGLWL